MCTNCKECRIYIHASIYLYTHVLWQESVDICDFAVGLSRALNGSIIPSERSVPASAFECIMHSPPAGLLLLFPLTTKHTRTYDPQNKIAPGTS